MLSSANVRRSFFAIALIALMLGAGCSSTPKPTDTAPTDQGVTDSPIDNMGKSSDENGAAGLQTVNFPYDSFTLDSVAKSTLKSNADVLKQKSSIKIQVEGHCDQRGGIQYNIALGEKRANAVRKYLLDQGVAGERVTTISFGKERPIDAGSSEESFARNRRANFVVTSN